MTVLSLVVDNPAPLRRPRAPSTLGDVGRAEWKRVIASLSASDNLADDRLSLVQAYCEAIEGADECARILKKEGRVIHQRGKPAKAHPTVRSHLLYQQQALRLAERLGIVSGADPKSRKVNERPSPTLDY